ncbi:MAG: hypothetical protein A3A61_04325 [Candidatus Woykebacteria bacterium RIFCSPLOWO2_01_FULL_43_14]|uniref:Uncharacterized protein n=2 Tax=Candidatus Woykeibacteriota TaxID=1817899 RepID=A0A1G1WX31_9BACT|nr:MAG: hypothetical protein A3J50_02625 [Candidatus Woykebacteria bacterium RIFCSPHIGHO2_02_FULL_43_16b]OGY32285.1 MAG: hypothetical protein A3A61_04325 [Candidatus Woykebacteria bacterium RIFCSPLOWO2_01_FULL_43_14]
MDNFEELRDEGLQDYIKELVVARINALSKELEISVGGENITREEILKSVMEGNELGREVIEMQLKFLRDISEGKIYQSG